MAHSYNISVTMRFVDKLLNFLKPEPSLQAVSSYMDDKDKFWADLEKAEQDRSPIECQVEWANQYGVLVSYHGIETYVARHYLGLDSNEEHRDLVGKTLKFVVRSAPRNGKLLLSRQPIAAAEKRTAIRRQLEHIALGQEVSGQVIKVKKRKVIVRLDEYPDATAVINSTSLKRRFIVDMAEEFAVGDEVDAIVTGTQPGRATIYICPLEHVQDPWETVTEKLKVGQIVDGTITTCTKYGVFVELLPGITGLVRAYDLDWNKVDPADFGQRGDPIRVQIMSIDPEEHRIALSRKHTMPDPRKDFAARYHTGDELEGTVYNITDFGLFVELAEGVHGLLHASELHLNQDSDRKATMQALHPVGSKLKVRLILIENEGARIGLAPV